MSGKWTKDCEVQQYLENLILNGKIKVDDEPNEIYEKYTAFCQYSLDVFRKNFNLTKKSHVNEQPKKVTAIVECKVTRQSCKQGESLNYIFYFEITLKI